MIVRLVDTLFLVFTMMLFIRILSSWVPEVQKYRVMQFISFYTDPYLNLFRRIIPPIGIIDISPMAAYFALVIVKGLVLSLLR